MQKNVESDTFTAESMSSAFTDLEALMVKASEMVALAQSMSDRLNNSKTSENENEIDTLNTLIRSLGLSNQTITS